VAGCFLAWLTLDALFSGNTKLNQVVQLRVALNLKIRAAAFSHKSVNLGIVGFTLLQMMTMTNSTPLRPPPLAAPNPVQDQHEQEQLALINAFIATVRHFFGGFVHLFCSIRDPRHPSFTIYPLPAVCFAGLLMFLCRLGSRRQINNLLRGNGPSGAKFQMLFGVETCPHGDTANVLFSRLLPDEVQEVVCLIIETLVRKKVLDRYRLLGRYFTISVDGTGRLVFPERHCPHCLTRTHNGKTTYYHPVLEAKLVTPFGFVFSIMTEFVENPGENPTKQDCELKAFYRLAKRLKQRFPRLPICLLLDGLFAGGPTFALCKKYRWKYLVVLQEDDLSSVHEEFEALLSLAPENHLRFRTGVQREIHQDFRWMNDISYVDSEKREHTITVIECLETRPDADGNPQTTRFKWITNLNVKRNTVIIVANEGGRLRWKIENEGFNVQKNGGYALEHAYTRNATASKIFYYLLQVAHIIAQLIERGSLFRKAFPSGVGSAKNIAFRLLEAWRNFRLTDEQLHLMLSVRIQIRFKPP
jgi:hypothetical protein